jgi:hypothetical protein
MFDFFSLTLPGKYSTQLLKSENLGFEVKTVNNTGEIPTTKKGYIRYKATFSEFVIMVWTHPTKPHRIEIKGSFHKFHEGGTNWRDFRFSDFQNAVTSFSKLLNIEVNQFKIHGIEIGVNISPPFDTAKLIEGIKTFAGRKFDRESFDRNGLLFKFDFSFHRIKIYDKFRQYAQIENGPKFPILRFELKVKKMAYLKNKGVNITTLQDLVSGEWNVMFGDLLARQIDKLIICPEGMVNPDFIENPRSRKNFVNGMNPDYWTGLSSKVYERQFKAFRQNFKQLSKLDLYSDLKSRVQTKWDLLSFAAVNSQRGKNYPYVKGNINPLPNTNDLESRFCKSCGRNISHRRNTLFCSAKDVGEKAAHKCRNKDSNPRNSRKYKENRLYPGATLFPAQIHW